MSRHLRALEEALGCSLVIRGRGQRRVELTDRGRDFVQVAEKWRILWQEAREVASRILFMDGGHILEQNTPKEFFDHPQHPRTQLFLSKVL